MKVNSLDKKNSNNFKNWWICHLLTSLKYAFINLLWASSIKQISADPAGIYLLKVNNINTRTKWEICSKLIIKIPERRYWRHSGIFIVNFEHISHLVLVFLLLTLKCNCWLGRNVLYKESSPNFASNIKRSKLINFYFSFGFLMIWEGVEDNRSAKIRLILEAKFSNDF